MFNAEAKEEDISHFFESHQWTIPDDYKQFLQLHNGAWLFTHPEYGGGMNIFSMSDIILFRTDYEYMFPEYCYPIAMMDCAMILIDTHAQRAGKSYLFWQDCVNTNERAVDLKMNFETWLELFIISQGSEFWFWPDHIPPH
ncbi:SMI1/KNR4 family protein [Paenibacillus sp. HB172176]|uniref:SMI1/KNR4 family protein n=1 Tax=Paenibacillus sp. HB172176 TaxID=2493690 RepID=UPI00143B1074|nr:SMI1/KNR4 family protein [Paenibacillus sp. HB172176]